MRHSFVTLTGLLLALFNVDVARAAVVRPSSPRARPPGKVVGDVVRAHREGDGAVTLLRFTHTSPQDVQTALLTRDPRVFAKPSATYFRHPTPAGQAMLQSPVPGIPIMRTTFERYVAPRGETLTLVRGVGFMKGGGFIRAYQDGPHTYVEEPHMTGQLDLRFVPMAGQAYGFAELLPGVGARLRAMREWVEYQVGKATAAVHVQFVKHMSADGLANALNEMYGN
jgi:hypothetical protein